MKNYEVADIKLDLINRIREKLSKMNEKPNQGQEYYRALTETYEILLEEMRNI